MPSALVLSELGDETWGAVLEQGQVVELHVENARRPGIAGSIYKGRVNRILPGMQSAFIDIGIEKDAFLHVADIPAARPGEFDFEADEEPEIDPEANGGKGNEAVSGPGGAGEVREGLDDELAMRPRLPAAPIQDLLREGQEILVQVAKEPIAAKGARVTAQIALPGRALVYLPFMERVFVSRRIEDAAERERVRLLTERASGGEGGWIVRTVADGASEAVLQRDAAYLKGLWKTIQEREKRSGAPALLHPDLSLAERLLRDVVSEEFSEVVVDSQGLMESATSFIDRYLPGLGVRVRVVEKGWTLFEELGIHQEIERALQPRIWLKTGGSIVVNPTEALVAIDVNTGKYVGKENLEETALRTNLEAVREIVRLLRLRDLGGIIVIDFIDMIEQKNREALSRELSEELRKDRSRSRLLAMSDFGLVQLTRKRTRRSLDRTLQIPCPACGGGGRIRSPIALYYEIQRTLARGAALAGPDGPIVRLNPATIARLAEEGLQFAARRDWASEPIPIRIHADPALSEERFELIW